MSWHTRLLIALSVFFVTACVSEPIRDRYFSLVLAADDVPAQPGNMKDSTRLVVGPVRVARYLNQAGLAMQKGNHQIQIANHSYWAEPLDEGIAKVLVRDLGRRNSSLTVSRESGRWQGEGDCQLRLEFDKFQATDASSVVARGRYWISSTSAESDVLQGGFDLSRALKVDGYDNAVNEMRALIAELSDQLTAVIEQERSCITSHTSDVEKLPSMDSPV